MLRKYYSFRTKKRSDNYGLEILKKLFLNLYKDFEEPGYFQEYFGYCCVDQKWVLGKMGDSKAIIFKSLLKELPWPPDGIDIFDEINIDVYTEDDLFDIIEFLFDYVSEPIDGQYHSWNNCGWHYSVFNKENGQGEFLKRINEILLNYKDGFEMSKQGQILTKETQGLTDIFQAEIPLKKDKDIQAKINLAIQKYRGSRSDMEERRIAIRELADILEFLRPKIKKYMLGKDDDTLFNLANNFYIRHSNEKQIKSYDKNIWYSWMFYFYLSTIHALLRLDHKYGKI